MLSVDGRYFYDRKETNTVIRNFLKSKYSGIKFNVKRSSYRGSVGVMIECPDIDGVDATKIVNEVALLLDAQPQIHSYLCDFVDYVYVDAPAAGN